MKTYCISDIHGHYDNLKRFMDTLNEEDRVFVLGDVVDKGSEPIKCLLTIMNEKRFTMLLGNHDYMMYCYLTSEEGSYYRKWMEDQWIIWNGGSDTMKDSARYSEKDRENIIEYIRNLPINIPDLEVGGHHFYLVHSNPAGEEAVTMADLDYDDDRVGEYIWERRNPFDKLEIKGRTVIAGHTPIQANFYNYNEDVKPYADSYEMDKVSYVDIDGGLACDLPNSKLIALCLDDMSYKLY